MPYAVEMSDWALDFIDKHVTRETVFARIEWAIDILGEYPAFGPSYEPGYAAARPPFPCRYLPLSDTPFTLYYVKDDESKKVTIIDIEWSAGDPLKRFVGMPSF